VTNAIDTARDDLEAYLQRLQRERAAIDARVAAVERELGRRGSAPAPRSRGRREVRDVTALIEFGEKWR